MGRYGEMRGAHLAAGEGGGAPRGQFEGGPARGHPRCAETRRSASRGRRCRSRTRATRRASSPPAPSPLPTSPHLSPPLPIGRASSPSTRSRCRSRCVSTSTCGCCRRQSAVASLAVADGEVGVANGVSRGCPEFRRRLVGDLCNRGDRTHHRGAMDMGRCGEMWGDIGR